MREESRAGQRYLNIMDLCNRESNQEESGLQQTQPSKRHRSSAPEHGRARRRRKDPDQPSKPPKRKRRRNRHSHAPSPPPTSPGSETESGRATPERAVSTHCRSHSRKRHNLVEQKYRQRLNSQFKQLLDILPTSSLDTDFTHFAHSPSPSLATGNGTQGPLTGRWKGAFTTHADRAEQPAKFDTSPTSLIKQTLSLPTTPHHILIHTANGPQENRDQDKDGADDHRRVSKGEVLDRARRYIEVLEREHRRLLAERRELEVLWEGRGYSGSNVGKRVSPVGGVNGVVKGEGARVMF